jgi:hypothetical protein
LSLLHPVPVGLVFCEHEDEPAAADGAGQRGDPDREGGGPAAEARYRHLELGLADLTVPANLPGEGGELAHHEPVALDDPEGAGGGAGAQHAVLTVDDDGGRRKYGKDRRNPWRQFRRLLRGSEPRVPRLPHSLSRTRLHRHAVSLTWEDICLRSGTRGSDQSILTYLMVCAASGATTIERLPEISLFSGCSPSRKSPDIR